MTHNDTCFECGAPAEHQYQLVPGGHKTLGFCSRCMDLVLIGESIGACQGAEPEGSDP